MSVQSRLVPLGQFLWLVMMVLVLVRPRAIAAEPSVETLLNATDDIARGSSSVATVTMAVKTKRYSREVTMKAWSRGDDSSLIVLQSPAREAGVATLMVDDNIWNYLPKVDRTVKLPAAMMGGSWMGSHFTNDDLVKSSRLADDFAAEISERPNDAQDVQHYAVTLVPKPDAPVVWGKVVVRVTPEPMPLSIAYFDEEGELVRTMTYLDVKDFDGHRVPALMRVVPADRPEEYTEIRYESLGFDVEIPAETFTLQALQQQPSTGR